MEASHVYINERAVQEDATAQYKIGKEYVDFKKINTKRSVLADSLFLRFMQSSITRIVVLCQDLVQVKMRNFSPF